MRDRCSAFNKILFPGQKKNGKTCMVSRRKNEKIGCVKKSAALSDVRAINFTRQERGGERKKKCFFKLDWKWRKSVVVA